MDFKEEIIETMEENGFSKVDGRGMSSWERGEDEISFGWWGNEKVAKADRAYKAHLFVALPLGRYRLPFTKFVENKDGEMVEKSRDWEDFKEEFENVFLRTFSSEDAIIELIGNRRYTIKAVAPELEEK